MTYYQAECFRGGECFEKDMTLELRGGKIDCRSVCEDIVFYSDAGQPEATLFMQAWLRRDDAKETRPVMFAWNGGPGSASSMLQLECLGPYLIDRDENGGYRFGVHLDPDCLLDVCDIVYMDQIGVGYSRLIDKSLEKKYYSVDGDARVYAFAIAKWLKKHGRLNSPVYLLGESYGTIRACRVLAELGRSSYSESRMVLGLPPRGVILVGNATSMNGRGDTLEPGLELTVAMMPAMAAIHWYHHRENMGGVAQDEFVEEAWRFAGSELLSAYFAGSTISEEMRRNVAQKISHFTGLSAEYFMTHNLRVAKEEDFQTGVAADKGCLVDIYDGRLTSPLSEGYNPIGNPDNLPLKVMNSRMEEIRGIASERMYYTGNLTGNPVWNMDTEDVPGKKTHIQCLESAMMSNQRLRVLFASGLYDLCTHAGNTRYQLAHSRLPMDRVVSREYPGGHGVYSTAEGKARFLQDIRDLIG